MISSEPLTRQRVEVQGVVQGVGFRPFVYGLAVNLGLVGFVGNDSRGVFIEVEGPPSALSIFQQRLRLAAPPMAHVETISTQTLPPAKETKFFIMHSQMQAGDNTLISPDLVTCEDCLVELFDPNNRRYRYPFINCTNCGPRFTIIRDIPYDRPLTTMADFVMCPDCQAEYENPYNRRFHAQPNACPVCGPQVEFRWSTNIDPKDFENLSGLTHQDLNPIQMAQAVIAQGCIVAVKGLGGFHLACDATNDSAVRLLRERKGRVDKPFAIMAYDLSTIRQFAQVNSQEQRLLTSRERPIVLLKKKPNNLVSELIAPGNQYIGVMLPYNPLHYLLLASPKKSKICTERSRSIQNRKPEIVVMTSGNYANKPIVRDNDEAVRRLSPLVDGFLLHNRDIHARCDDSVIRVFESHELPIRRSRGYTPFPIKLPFSIPSVLAVGGELKSTFCLTKDDYAFISQHIGDMENIETLQALSQAVSHFKSLFRVQPQLVVADMHPGYLSTRWALENSAGRELIKVQHHHAHLAALMAEHGLDGQKPVLGFCFDGTGYGLDGAIWGGEVVTASYQDFERVAHLKYIPLPGGDAAIKRPYRIALAHLWAANLPWDEMLPPVATCPPIERDVLKRQFETGFNTAPTSSMGRLFDAVASLVGVRQTVTYEGQAAIELESLAAQDVADSYEFNCIKRANGPMEIDVSPIIRGIVADLQAVVSPAVIAARFHNSVAEMVLRLSLMLRAETGLNQVALSGGVFQNITLLSLIIKRLRQENFEILAHRLVPPNDGGLALGQAMIAGCRLQTT